MNFYILYILYQKNQKKRPKRLEENKKKQVLLLTAHPDDEIMFFYPLLKYLISEQFSIHVLCLTYGQLGKDPASEVRKKEFEKVMNTLSIKNFQLVNSSKLKDSQDIQWDMEEIGTHVDKYVKENSINCVFSFDRDGISKHCNHSDVSLFLDTRLKKYEERNIKIYMLESVNIIRKYVILVDLIYIMLIEFVNVFGIIVRGKEIFNNFMFFNLDFR